MQKFVEPPSTSRLNGLIKQKRNAEFKSLLSNIDLSHNEGANFIHAAAMCNNVDAIEHLLSSGCNVNSRNSRGQTALAIAFSYNSFQAAHSLLSHDADIWSLDVEGRSALQICFKKRRRAPDFVIEKLFEEMKKCELSTQQIIEELADCSLDHLLLMKNAEVLGLVLDRQTSISRWESRALLDRAMKLNFQENVKVLLKRGPNSSERRRIFFDRVTRHIINPKTYPYFRRLVDWEVIDRPMLSLSVWFFESQKEYMRRALLDLGVAQYARRKLGLELLARSCHNRFTDVARLLRQGHLGGSGLDLLGFGALHWAAMAKNSQAVALLLDHGADPNLRARRGWTPLFYAADRDEPTMQLLLDAGADPQLRDDEGRSVFRDRCWSEYLSAHMSVLQESGRLRPETCDALERDYRNSYWYQLGESRLDFAWMRSRRVGKDASLFDVLVDAPEEIARYVRDEDTVAAILQVSRERELSMPAHATMIRRNLERAMEVHGLRPVAAEFLREVLGVAHSGHLVIRRIVEYLTYGDLSRIRKSEELRKIRGKTMTRC